jgi:hypothetical protein
MVNVYEERGRKQGLQQGREEGRDVGMQDAILRLLSARFGEPGPELVAAVRAVHGDSELDALLERVIRAASLEEVGIVPN